MQTEQPKPETATTSSPIDPWISQTARALKKRSGGDVKVPRGCYAPKHEPSNKLNRRESNRNRALPKVWVPTEILQSEDEFVLQLSRIPTNKCEPKHLRIEGTRRAKKSNENSSKNTRKSHELQEGDWRNHESFHSLRGQILYKWVKI
jgi:hypothetical protein